MAVKGVNREYKDRLFKFIFGSPENKEWTLSLYNAINGTHYTDADAIEFNTIEDAVYMSMKNDLSFLFLIENIMNLYEHQGSFNPNMPMRFLIYAGILYSRYIDDKNNKYMKFSSKQQKAPTPRCICFYNGTDEKEDRIILKLSDSFEKDSKPDIEVTVTMININYGHNMELLNACKPLKEYSWFVDRIRSSQKEEIPLGEAISRVIAEMPEDWLVKPFLVKNQEEVTLMCITEYDEERTITEFKEEAREEGRVEGKAEGFLKALVGLVKKDLLTLSQAAEEANMTVEEFESKTAELNIW